MKKQDLRIIKTKKALYQSLIQLMKEKTFEEIRVSDVCELALINRSTFYAHFDDKYELLYDYIKNLKNDLKTELSKNKEISNTKEYYIEMIKILLNHVEDKKEIYRSIMLHNQNSIMADIIYNALNEDALDHIQDSKTNNIGIPSEIIFKFYLGAVACIGIEWLKNDHYSKQDIIHYLDTLIPNQF